MIDKLEYLVALDREKHFGRAAVRSGVTQPTLSAGLKQLEDALGLLLVKRSSRFIGFTPEGERVLAWAHRLVGDARAMQQDVSAMKHGLNGHLRLAVIPSALPTVPGLTTSFAARHPAVRFTVVSRTSDEVLRRVDRFEADAGVTYLDADGLAHVRTVPLYYERYRFVVSRGAVAPGTSSVAWADAGHAALCLLTPDMQNRRNIDRVSRSLGVDLSPKLETDSVLVLLAHVRTGRWASIIPAALLDVMGLPDDVAALPLVAPEVGHLIGLVVPDRNPMTPLVQALFAETHRFEPLRL